MKVNIVMLKDITSFTKKVIKFFIIVNIKLNQMFYSGYLLILKQTEVTFSKNIISCTRNRDIDFANFPFCK